VSELDRLIGRVDKLEIELKGDGPHAGVRQDLALLRQATAPIGAVLDDHDARITSLEEARTEARGGARVLGLIRANPAIAALLGVTVLGGSGTGVIAAVIGGDEPEPPAAVTPALVDAGTDADGSG
jgi:hypothetical protein